MTRLTRYALPLAVAVILFTAMPAAAILQKGDAAPPIRLTTTAGQPITLTNYRGYVLVMDFFATWCQPCKNAIPHLNQLNHKYGKQGLQILGVSVDEGSDREVKSFVVDKKVSYPVAIAGDDLQADYGLRSVPTLYVINKRGMVADKFFGYSDQTAKAIEDLIKRLLVEP